MTRLDAIRNRAEAATPGPWGVDSSNGFIKAAEPRVTLAHMWDKFEEDFPNCVDNSDFIAHARSDIPYLLELVQELRDASLAYLYAHSPGSPELRAAIARCDELEVG